MSHDHPHLDPELKASVLDVFAKIPFNQQLGMTLPYADFDRVDVKLDMKPELVGNFFHGILHGGVIASMLDVAGGCMALIGAYERTRDLDPETRMNILSKVGTIDLRVDFLRPGKGEHFLASARLLRIGNKVAVTRMELHNERDHLLALGTGTYMCG